MRICLIRHGETDYNAEKRLQGQVEIPLNENGRKQAAETAKALSVLHWDRIFTSPLGRARETAQKIAQVCGLPAPVVIPELIERGLGVAEGQISADFSEEIRRLYHEEKLEGMEPKTAVQARMVTAITNTIAEYPHENILFVSHGGAIRQFMNWLNPEGFGISKNCSMNLLETTEKGLQIILSNASPEEWLQRFSM